jgi:hypothetical protein
MGPADRHFLNKTAGQMTAAICILGSILLLWLGVPADFAILGTLVLGIVAGVAHVRQETRKHDNPPPGRTTENRS